MHIRKYLSIFLIGSVFVIAGCSSDSSSGISEEDRLPDTDNDGIVDKHDPDIDGDGILNKDDADDDGDGTPDTTDPTPNGDGGEAPTPGLACTSAIVLPPKEGITGRLNTASWELLPEGCETTVSRLIVVTASADQASPLSTDGNTATSESQSAYLGKLTTNIILPQDCDWEGTIPITYDFSEIGNALGDSSPGYTPTADAKAGRCKGPAVDLARISHHNTATCTRESSGRVSCKGGSNPQGTPDQYYYVWTRVTGDWKIDWYEHPPTWSATGDLFMNIYLTCDDGNESVKYSPTYVEEGTYNDWDDLITDKSGCKVRTNYFDNIGVGWENRPYPGNFILKIGTPDTTISRYRIPAPSS